MRLAVPDKIGTLQLIGFTGIFSFLLVVTHVKSCILSAFIVISHPGVYIENYLITCGTNTILYKYVQFKCNKYHLFENKNVVLPRTCTVSNKAPGCLHKMIHIELIVAVSHIDIPAPAAAVAVEACTHLSLHDLPSRLWVYTCIGTKALFTHS